MSGRVSVSAAVWGYRHRGRWAVLRERHADDGEIASRIEKLFDMRPYAIEKRFNLRKPIYLETAAYGHFGREDIDLSWEQTNKVEALKASTS